MRQLIVIALIFSAQVHADECLDLVNQSIEAGVDAPVDACDEIRRGDLDAAAADASFELKALKIAMKLINEALQVAGLED